MKSKKKRSADRLKILHEFSCHNAAYCSPWFCRKCKYYYCNEYDCAHCLKEDIKNWALYKLEKNNKYSGGQADGTD